MAVLHSWPLASDPAHLARLDNHDAELNTWIVAWVAHILPRDPLSLFEAPILYPEHHSLAFSEHMFVPSVMGAPLLWVGRLAGAGLQPADHRRPRAVGLVDVPADAALDRQRVGRASSPACSTHSTRTC